MKPFRLLALASCLLVSASLAMAAGDPNGTWKFKTEIRGTTTESTLILKWADHQLTGSIDNRAGKVDITEPGFADDRVTFTVVRELGKSARKKTFTVHYSGKLEGDAIKGTIETTGRDQKPISVKWEAQRVK